MEQLNGTIRGLLFISPVSSYSCTFILYCSVWESVFSGGIRWHWSVEVHNSRLNYISFIYYFFCHLNLVNYAVAAGAVWNRTVDSRYKYFYDLFVIMRWVMFYCILYRSGTLRSWKPVWVCTQALSSKWTGANMQQGEWNIKFIYKDCSSRRPHPYAVCNLNITQQHKSCKNSKRYKIVLNNKTSPTTLHPSFQLAVQSLF